MDHSESLEMAPFDFDRSNRSSYSSSIVSTCMAISCIVSNIKLDIGRKFVIDFSYPSSV